MCVFSARRQTLIDWHGVSVLNDEMVVTDLKRQKYSHHCPRISCKHARCMYVY